MLHFRKTLRWVLISVAATLLPLLIMSQFPDLDIPAPYWIVAVVLPASISYVVSRKLVQQTEELAELNRELTEAYVLLKRVSEVDHLTQILNRGAFMRHLELSRTSQAGRLLLLDIDHFKSINDNFGHEAGDRALQSVVSSLRKAVRFNDIIGRLGGEEFGIYLPATTDQLAVEIAERIRDKVEKTKVDGFSESQLTLTVSIGIAPVEPHCDLTDCLRLADLSMYQAKKNGRNQVILAA
jgi:diguanylate cyclase (GGDEF)-like protein